MSLRIRTLPFFRRVNWEPDAAELRRFSLAMLIGFGILGLIAAWRGHGFGTPTYLLWAAGAVLALGAQIPGVGRGVYLAVYLPTSILGYVVSHVLLTLIFFGVFTPIALILRATGKDLLQLRAGKAPSRWTARTETRDVDSYYRQF